MKKWFPAFIIILGLVCSMLQPGSATAMAGAKNDTDEVCLSPKMVQLKSDMQKLWINHTIWTRSYIVSAMSSRADQQDVLNRLLQNQQDIGNAFKPYYGEAAGNKLAELLKQHILIAGQIVAAAKAGNQADVKKWDTEWHQNADQISKFLSELNPNWPFQTIQEMFYTHLQLITEIVINCLKGNWQADIAATDKNETHMIHLADLLTEGIVKQFPEKF